jgi:hypothetical protein
VVLLALPDSLAVAFVGVNGDLTNGTLDQQRPVSDLARQGGQPIWSYAIVQPGQVLVHCVDLFGRLRPDHLAKPISDVVPGEPLKCSRSVLLAPYGEIFPPGSELPSAVAIGRGAVIADRGQLFEDAGYFCERHAMRLPTK